VAVILLALPEHSETTVSFQNLVDWAMQHIEDQFSNQPPLISGRNS
jgi:nitrate reductase cytochrome c-type subunit